MNNSRNLAVAIIGAVALLALGVVLGGIITRPANSAEAQTVPTTGQYDRHGITVNGQGVVLVKPDVVKLSIGVDERGDTVQDVQQKANSKQDAIKKALTDLKISPDDIQTTDYYISPNYRSDSTGTSKLQGYIITSRLQVTIRNTADAGKVIDGATTAGANQVGNIQFTLDNNAAALKQAREAAMQDAKAKADQLAGAGGFQTGSVLGVSEQGSNLPPAPVVMAGAAANGASAASAPTNIEDGQFRVQVSVQVTYNIK